MSRVGNKDLIRLLEIVLDICTQIIEQKSENAIWEICGISNLGENKSESKHFADKFCDFIYKAYQDVTNEKISITDGKIILKFNNGTELEANTPFEKLNYLPMNQQNETEQLKQLSEKLEESFLVNRKIKELQERIRQFLDIREKIILCNTPFPSFEKIEEYLEKYYALLMYLMVNENLVNTSEAVANLLSLLLHLDTNHEQASILCPVGMNAIRKMYLGIEEYYKQITTSSTYDSVLNLFYKNVIIRKIQHSFRWFAYGNDGKLYHYAVSPSVETFGREGNLLVKARDIEDYNSFEGIGEKRVAEKILYEIHKEFKNNKDKNLNAPKMEFHIALLGDIRKNPMEKMIEYVHNVLQTDSTYYDESRGMPVEADLYYNVYSKNFFKEDCGQENQITPENKQTAAGKIVYNGELDEIFVDKKKMEQLIEDNQIIFMLDCIKLYQPMEISPYGDINMLKQTFIFGEFMDAATTEKIDLCAPNLLESLFDIMNVYNQKKVFGVLRKQANDLLLKFCEDKVNQLREERNHTLYVYVSDLRAFNNVYCHDDYFMRTERYNQKEIGIIRYTNRNIEERSLPQGDGKPIICFSVWQIVKHIALEKCEDIVKQVIKLTKKKEGLKGEEFGEHILQRLYFGIDYGNWRNQLILYYGVKGETCEEEKRHFYEFLRKFAEGVVIPIFNNGRGNLFQQYFWRTMYSLLYGSAQNVRDMVFIHLLYRNSEKVEDTFLCDDSRNNPKLVQDNINKKYKFSIKRFYEKLIQEYDVSAGDSIDQNWVSFIIEKSNRNRTMKDTKEEMFQKVVAVCEILEYEEDYLCKNCRKVLGIN